MAPIPAYARVQSTVEKKQRIEEIHRIGHDLLHEQVTLQLEVEMEEDRPESYRAKWCRAWLAHDMAECDRLLALEYPNAQEG